MAFEQAKGLLPNVPSTSLGYAVAVAPSRGCELQIPHTAGKKHGKLTSKVVKGIFTHKDFQSISILTLTYKLFRVCLHGIQFKHTFSVHNIWIH